MNLDVIVGGAIVLVGVLLAELFVRSRQWRSSLESTTRELTFHLPIHLAFFSEIPGTPDPEPGFDAPSWHAGQTTLRLLAEIRSSSRWPIRQAKAIRTAIDDLAARVIAAEERHRLGKPLTALDMLNIASHGIHGLVFGERDTIDSLIRKYIDEGFPSQDGD